MIKKSNEISLDRHLKNKFEGTKVLLKVNWIIEYLLYPDSVNIFKLTIQYKI